MGGGGADKYVCEIIAVYARGGWGCAPPGKVLACEFGTITKCPVYIYTRVHGQISSVPNIASSQPTMC